MSAIVVLALIISYIFTGKDALIISAGLFSIAMSLEILSTNINKNSINNLLKAILDTRK